MGPKDLHVHVGLGIPDHDGVPDPNKLRLWQQVFSVLA